MEKHKFNIHDKRWYEYGASPDMQSRTLARLTTIADLGMQETGTASFGIEGVMSGLYIEKVWRYNEKDWTGYINWVIELIEQKAK